MNLTPAPTALLVALTVAASALVAPAVALADTPAPEGPIGPVDVTNPPAAAARGRPDRVAVHGWNDAEHRRTRRVASSGRHRGIPGLLPPSAGHLDVHGDGARRDCDGDRQRVT